MTNTKKDKMTMTTKHETKQIEQHAAKIRNVRLEMERELGELDRAVKITYGGTIHYSSASVTLAMERDLQKLESALEMLNEENKSS